MKKRLLSLLLALAMCLSLSVPVWANPTLLSTQAKADHLIEHGIPQNIVEDMTPATIDALYSETLNNCVTLVSHVEQPGLITIPNGELCPRIVSDGDFTLSLSVYASNDSAGNFLYYFVTSQYQWDSIPNHHYVDAMYLDWPRNYLTLDGDSFHYSPYYKLTNGSWTYDTATATSDPSIAIQGGVGLVFDLKDAVLPTDDFYYYKGSITFRLLKASPSSTGNTVQINTNYAHTVNSTGGKTITVGSSGVSLDFVCEKEYQRQAKAVTVTIP
ncbi:MAG: hypothetical protein J6J01_00075 [Oscillospiraceae bacterium]|nr:hypothetical protein [Prevotella sp.]MBO5122944.1 hypothetical protein [Oscillospiraceae bacterium]MBP3697864.1 hypothetical protein [Oscillospiraceae bacterium]